MFFWCVFYSLKLSVYVPQSFFYVKFVKGCVDMPIPQVLDDIAERQKKPTAVDYTRRLQRFFFT